MKNINHENTKHEEPDVAILTLEKVDLKIQKTTRNKEGHFIMIKGKKQ